MPFRVTSRHSTIERMANESSVNMGPTVEACNLLHRRIAPDLAAETRNRAAAELGVGGGFGGLRRACIWFRISV